MEKDKITDYLAKTNLVAITNHTITDPYIILKKLDDVRVRGYSIVYEEIVFGWISLAAPIFQGDGSVEAAVSIAGVVSNFSNDKTPLLISSLLRTAREISNDMGYNVMEV